MYFCVAKWKKNVWQATWNIHMELISIFPCEPETILVASQKGSNMLHKFLCHLGSWLKAHMCIVGYPTLNLNMLSYTLNISQIWDRLNPTKSQHQEEGRFLAAIPTFSTIASNLCFQACELLTYFTEGGTTWRPKALPSPFWFLQFIRTLGMYRSVNHDISAKLVASISILKKNTILSLGL